MKILVLGARGAVGGHIAEEAETRGHEVTAATRDVVDATDPDSVASAAASHDIVLSAVGDRAAPDSVPRVARAVLAGLERAGVPRLVLVGGAGTLETAAGGLVLDADDFNPDFKAEALAHLEALRRLRAGGTPVDWTVVTPARRFDDSGRTGSYRVGGDAVLLNENGASRISMEDFAVAILDEVEHPRHRQARFTVAY